LAQQLALLAAGFVLTTVLGGILGSYLQNRAWRHQFEIQRREREQTNAESALHEVTSLLDKRRYRMLMLYWYLRDADHTRPPTSVGERRLEQYQEVLYEWNDNLNRRLALVATNFGGDMKRTLDGLYEEYRQVGILLDDAFRGHRMAGDYQVANIGPRLNQLNIDNYQYSERGLLLLTDGQVGSDKPEDSQAGIPPLAPPSDTGH
jgi:hypothetical protein